LHIVLVRVLQRNRANRMCMCVRKYVYLYLYIWGRGRESNLIVRNWLMWLCSLRKSKISDGGDWQTGDSGETGILSPTAVCCRSRNNQCCRPSPKAVFERIPSSLREGQPLLHSGLQLLDEAHLHYEGQCAFLKDHWLKLLIIIQNTFTKISRIMLNHIYSRHCGTHKLITINHHLSHHYSYIKIALSDVVCLLATEIHSH